MKKLMALILAMIMLVSFAGCGGNAEDFIGTWTTKNGSMSLDIKSTGSFKFESTSKDFRGIYAGDWEENGNEILINLQYEGAIYSLPVRIVSDNTGKYLQLDVKKLGILTEITPGWTENVESYKFIYKNGKLL